MPEANSIPVPSNLIQTQKYFLHSTQLPNTPSLSPCGGRGEGEGAIVKALNAFVISLTVDNLMSKGEGHRAR